MGKREFLKGGLFDKPFMQTKVNTHSMSLKERLLGFLLGPGGVMIYFCCVKDLRELFYTSVCYVDELFGSGTYLTLTTVTSIIGVLVGIGIAYLIENTRCKAGRIRPWLLIGEVLLLISGVAIFFNPFANGTKGQLVWIWIANTLYTSFAVQLFGIRYNKIALSSRSSKERTKATTLFEIGHQIIGGVVIGFAVGSILYNLVLATDVSGRSWRILVGATAIIAIPCILLEYFWTRERVTEENMETLMDKEGNIANVPLMQQFKALFTDKYYILALIITVFVACADALQGNNIKANYCVWVLSGGDHQLAATVQTTYMAVGMAPLGFGIFLLMPFINKFGARKTTIGGCIVMAVSYIVCILFRSSTVVAYAGTFIASFGLLTVVYLVKIFEQQAGDSIEYKHGFRPEGMMSTTIIIAIYTALSAPLQGLYETGLHAFGYNEYAASQPNAVLNWIVFVWYGVVVLEALVIIVCLLFFDAEKNEETIKAEILERRKAAVLARGEEWVSDEEKELREKAEAERIFEENRVADLREKCEKKGLDFEVENKKYLDAKAVKDAKKALKESKKAVKAGRKSANANR